MESSRIDRLLAAAVFLAGAALFLSFEPWTRPLLLDAATWDYSAVELARGLVPYRDVFLHKTPGAAFVGAIGASLGPLLGVEPVLAAHAVFLLLGATAPLLLFLVCRRSMPAGAAFAAAVALLAYDEWVIAALEGCRPKVPTTVLGLAALLAAERGRPFLASLLGGSSVLCWQPGLAFLFGAWALLLRRGERRPARLFAIALTSLLPSALLLGWLAWKGALGDFFDQAVLFNLHYIESKARTPFGTLRAFARTIGAWNDIEMLLFPAALAGLLLRTRAVAAAATARVPLSIAVSGGIYLAMTFVSYQSWPDAILLGPLVASLLGAGLWSLLQTRLAPGFAAAFATLLLALAVFPDDRPKFHPPMDFDTQRAKFRALAEGLAPDDTVIGISTPEFFLHDGRRNGWKWPYFWFGVDDFAAAKTPGGFEGILAELDERRPPLLLVARLWAGPQRARFEEWAAPRYERSTLRLFPHLKKPLKVYRLRR